MGHRVLISPELLTDAELDARLMSGPETVWREGEHWRVCRYASAHEAIRLLRQGWELFEDGEEET
ncbi:hypothetical protein GI582_05375 [Sulfitobacter sp. BDSS02]|uniref:hypothetical protein n=1 Tax=Rhodobacterales TaxID=204455 RepID=UPI000A269800|nr:hypothetical protein [Pseudooceanicola marinus]MBL3702127.1 hypothetical protein [Sulfitobacter sp. BDSS02]MBR9848476.1 hypothetical protein [Paracoccaceae bacterium]PJE33733.1 hypothetical protein CVM50_00490 [Pseudooceanicola marinus]